MGGLLSTLRCSEKSKLVSRRVSALVGAFWSTAQTTVWTLATAALVLVAPVVFHYEKECQMFEMQAQFMQAQQQPTNF